MFCKLRRKFNDMFSFYCKEYTNLNVKPAKDSQNISILKLQKRIKFSAFKHTPAVLKDCNNLVSLRERSTCAALGNHWLQFVDR